jgi:hypothetical protein
MQMRKAIFALGAGSFAVVAGLVVSCGSEDESKFKDGDGDSGANFPEGGFDPDAQRGDADLYANDPPPKYCGPNPQNAPPQPGGTIDCPDDKNKPGCGCFTIGEKKPCWTGLRKHRNIGICHDGETTCIATNETNSVWGECVGQQLPNPTATKGKEACMCFSAGQWKIKNLSPCLQKWNCTGDPDAGTETCEAYGATSTILNGDGTLKCDNPGPPYATQPPPAGDWSTDTLNVDCEGKFNLCFRIRAGDFKNPKSTDCILGEVCAESFYEKKNVEQVWPNLKAWVGQNTACAKTWETTAKNISPGYGEMLVKGESILCDAVGGDDFVFNRIEYCPRVCRDAANKDLPECKACQLSGQGQF